MMPAAAPDRSSPIAVPVGGGVHVVDTLYLRPGLAASHIVVDDGHAAFVDTGASPCVPRLLAAQRLPGRLVELGLQPCEQVVIGGAAGVDSRAEQVLEFRVAGDARRNHGLRFVSGHVPLGQLAVGEVPVPDQFMAAGAG